MGLFHRKRLSEIWYRSGISAEGATHRASHADFCDGRGDMTTEQQLNANRHYAEKSTGPRTAGGRARSRMNALKHGMAAEEIVVAGEDPAELRAFHKNLLKAWQPVGAMEEHLVWEITISNWRLRRAQGNEAKLVEVVFARYESRMRSNEREMDMMAAMLQGSKETKSESNMPVEKMAEERKVQSNEAKTADASEDRSATYVSEIFFESRGGGMEAIQLLLRYEAAAEQSYYRAVLTLERLQEKRMRNETSPPQAIQAQANE
jgi:hypothetical protein